MLKDYYITVTSKSIHGSGIWSASSPRVAINRGLGSIFMGYKLGPGDVLTVDCVLVQVKNGKNFIDRGNQ
jgi:hypothetical protein